MFLLATAVTYDCNGTLETVDTVLQRETSLVVLEYQGK